MRITAFLIALSVFFCYSSISSTADILLSEEQHAPPHCHIVSSGHMDSHSESQTARDYKFGAEVSLSSCCLNGLINHKDFENGFKIQQIFTIAYYSFETKKSTLFKSDKTFFKKGHSPPDINLLNSTFII